MTILIIFFLMCFVAVFLFSNTQRELGIYGNTGSIVMQGEIHADNNYPFYTHSIDITGGKLFLKSSYVNLNSFVGEDLVLVGDLMPTREGEVLNIQMIQNLQKDYILNGREYIFPNDFFILDAGEDTNLAIVQENLSKKVFYNGVEIFNVKSFVCNKIMKTHNCSDLKKNMTKRYAKTFTSPIGHYFYQFDEKTWYVLEKNAKIGYIFSISDESNEDDFVALSYVFKAIDGKYFIKNKQHILTNSCLNTGQKLEKIQKIKKESISNDTYLKLLLDLYIKSEENNQSSVIECKAQVNIADISSWLI